MNIHQTIAYKNSNGNESQFLQEENRILNDFEIVAKEFMKPFDSQFETEILNTSHKLKEITSQNLIYPTRIIESTNIIINGGKYLSSFENIQFASNMLYVVFMLISNSNFALQQLVEQKPAELLIRIYSVDNIELRRLINHIIKCFSMTDEGSQYIISSPLFQFVVDSPIELFKICQKETDSRHPYFDTVLDFLSIIHDLLRKQSDFLFQNIPYFIQLTTLCYSVPIHFAQSSDIIKSGIQILFYLSNSNHNQSIIENHLFEQTMAFLNDERYQNLWIPTLYFAAKFVESDFEQEPIFNNLETTKSLLYHVLSLLIGINHRSNQDIEEIHDYDDMVDQDEEESDDENSQHEEEIEEREDVFTQQLVNRETIQDEDFLAAAYSFLSNFCILSSEYVQILLEFDNFGAFMEKTIFSMTECRPKTRDLVFGFVWNILYIGLRQQKMQILSSGVMEVLPDSVEFEDANFLIMVENSINKIVECFQKIKLEPPFDTYVLQMAEIMKQLSFHDNHKVQENAQLFLHKYFHE